MTYIVRNAIPGDLDAIVELSGLLANFEKAVFDAAGKKEKYAGQLFATQPRSYCLVAEANGEAVGYVTWSFEYSIFEASDYSG